MYHRHKLLDLIYSNCVGDNLMIVMVVVTVTETINVTLLILRYPWFLYLLSYRGSRSPAVRLLQLF
jgi:hypothetical protein